MLQAGRLEPRLAAQRRSNEPMQTAAQSPQLAVPPMNPVAKALWFIESHFAGEITLDLIAQAGGVSRFAMARVFGEATW